MPSGGTAVQTGTMLSSKAKVAILNLSPESEWVQLVCSRERMRKAEVDRLFVELMKFLITVAAEPGQKLYVPPEIDRVWHWLILDQPYFSRILAHFEDSMPLHNPRDFGPSQEAFNVACSLGLMPDSELWKDEVVAAA